MILCKMFVQMNKHSHTVILKIILIVHTCERYEIAFIKHADKQKQKKNFEITWQKEL
jgi:hypothetical protein